MAYFGSEDGWTVGYEIWGDGCRVDYGWVVGYIKVCVIGVKEHLNFHASY